MIPCMSGHPLDVPDRDLRRGTPAGLGYPRYGRLSDKHCRLDVLVPDPQFPHPGTLVAGRSSNPLAASCDQLDPALPTGKSGLGHWHGVGDPAEQRQPADLPVRLPGRHLHPLLRRPPLPGTVGGGSR